MTEREGLPPERRQADRRSTGRRALAPTWLQAPYEPPPSPARVGLHALLVAIAQIPLGVALLAAGLFALMALAAHRLHPEARVGNCWTYAVPRMIRHGGYLGFRRVHGVTLFGLPLPHAMWLPRLGQVRMTYPRRRRAGWLPWFAVLFRYDVWAGDPHAHQADEASSLPDAWAPTGPPD